MGDGANLITRVVEFLDLFMSSKRCRLIRDEVELVDIILTICGLKKIKKSPLWRKLKE